jgi:DtxR family Mn-dependent transcriptional regulator
LVRIVHLEDEPPIVFAQLMAENLHPGLVLELTETTPQRIGFRAGGREHTLAPILAANVFVFPLTEKQISEMQPTEPLAGLSPGQRGRVVSLSPACRGAERRRLMDLGIVPGTVIGAELRSPGGDPTAYDIRGALIALRREQAALINIVRLEEVGV